MRKDQSKEDSFAVIYFYKMNGNHLPFIRVVLFQWGDDALDCVGRVWKTFIELEEKMHSFVF